MSKCFRNFEIFLIALSENVLQNDKILKYVIIILEYLMNMSGFKYKQYSYQMTNTSLNSNNVTYSHIKSLETTSIALIICIILFCGVGCAVNQTRRRR